MTHPPLILYRVVTTWTVTNDDGSVTTSDNVWYDGTDMGKAQFLFDREVKFDLVDGADKIVRKTVASSKQIRAARRTHRVPKPKKRS